MKNFNDQMELPLIGLVSDTGEPVELPIEEVLKPENINDGGFLMVLNNQMKDGKPTYLTDAGIAASMAMKPPQFSKIKQGIAHLAAVKRVLFMLACGNIGMHQWEAFQFGRVSIKQSEYEALKAKADAYDSIMNQARTAV